MSTSDTKDFDPSRYATLRLFSHINLKGTQVGGLLGCGLVLPFLAFRGYRQGKPLDIQSASKALAYSTGVGLLLSGPVFLLAFILSSVS